jgi:hypothetical protein
MRVQVRFVQILLLPHQRHEQQVNINHEGDIVQTVTTYIDEIVGLDAEGDIWRRDYLYDVKSRSWGWHNWYRLGGDRSR